MRVSSRLLLFFLFLLSYQNCSQFASVSSEMTQSNLASTGVVTTTLSTGPSNGLDCNQIPSTKDPSVNSTNIKYCLNTGARLAQLQAGVFPISEQVVLPSRATLRGAMQSGQRATVLVAASPTVTSWSDALSSAYSSASVLHMTSDGVVQDLRLTGNGQIVSECCASVLVVNGAHNQLSNLEIFNLDPVSGSAPQTVANVRVAGVYFLSGDAGESQLNNAFIHDVFMGVIFNSNPGLRLNNLVANTEIYRVECDGMSFKGQGIARNNKIHLVGFNCRNGSPAVPGAGIYAQDVQANVEIRDNQVFDVCGHGLDFVRSRGFIIENNSVSLKGHPFDGSTSFCAGGSAASFVDVSSFSVRGNSFLVQNGPALGAFIEAFPDFKSSTQKIYRYLPYLSKQVIGMRLLSVSKPVTSNTFDGNMMVATCGSDCVGTGFFVGPAVGTDANGTWSAQTTNYFTRNRVAGSNIGSIRCGKDWYAGNSQCQAGKMDGACNDDDPQHVPGQNASQYRSDLCKPY